MNFNKNPEVEAKAGALFSLLMNRARGAVVTHAEITTSIKLKPYQGEWTRVIERARDRLLDEREIELASVRGIGYKLSTEEEQLFANQMRHLKGVRKRVARMGNAVGVMKGLSDLNHQVRRAACLTAAHDLGRKVAQTQRHLGRWTTPPEVTP